MIVTLKPQKDMDTIDKFVKQQLENSLQIRLNKANNYLKEIELDANKLSIKTLYKYFIDLLAFNLDLDDIDINLLREYKQTINFFPRYFQKYINTYSNYITKVIKDKEKENRSLEEMSKEELIDLIRSQQ